MNTPKKTVAIIGAGPVGLAAAAHALERDLNPVIFESGPKVAHAIRQWGHVNLFSPWEYLIDSASHKLLKATNWQSPNLTDHPTGKQLVEQLLEPLAQTTPLKHHIKTSSPVTEISRIGFDKVKTKNRHKAAFEIRYTNDSKQKTLLADAVIDASGTWFTPNPAGANGLFAIGEKQASAHISYAMPDILGKQRTRFAGKKTAVLGAGHSAIGTMNSLVKLAEQFPKTQIIWLLRTDKTQQAFGGGKDDQLAARGELGTRFKHMIEQGNIQVETGFKLEHISNTGTGLKLSTHERHINVDELIVSTGFRPDFSFTRELRVELDPALECPPILAPLIDPNEHSCGTVRPHGAKELTHPEPNFYIAGMKSYGRAPTFLTLTGYEQVRSIIAHIAGDYKAAERVELTLPETGVCSSSSDENTGCCGGTPKNNANACCVLDEQAKADGKEGCGCGVL